MEDWKNKDSYDTLPITLLAQGEFYNQIWSKMPDEEIISRWQRIQDVGYDPIKVTAVVNGDGKHVILKGNRAFDVLTSHGYEIVKVDYKPIPIVDAAYEHLTLNKRKRLTKRSMAMMIPFLQDWYNRHINLKKETDDKVEKRTRIWLSEFFTGLGSPIGYKGIDKLNFIKDNTPELLDRLDSDRNILDSTYKVALDIVGGKNKGVPTPETQNNATTSNDDEAEVEQPQQSANPQAGNDDCDCTVPDNEYKLCGPCYMQWVRFNEKNQIKPIDGEEDKNVEP